MSAEEFYQPNEITECPSCGSGVRDPLYPKCWHCSKCGFAVCAYYKREVDEIRARRTDAVEEKSRRTTAPCRSLRT